MGRARASADPSECAEIPARSRAAAAWRGERGTQLHRPRGEANSARPADSPVNHYRRSAKGCKGTSTGRGAESFLRTMGTGDFAIRALYKQPRAHGKSRIVRGHAIRSGETNFRCCPLVCVLWPLGDN